MVCGRRVDDGASRCEQHKTSGRRMQSCLVCGRPSKARFCAEHEPKVDEALRLERNPYRQAYKSALYATNRQHRYERARGRCENCGTHVGAGEWECDHVITVREWTRRGLPGDPNDISNLRILCTLCHKTKTRHDRQQRKEAS